MAAYAQFGYSYPTASQVFNLQTSWVRLQIEFAFESRVHAKLFIYIMEKK